MATIIEFPKTHSAREALRRYFRRLKAQRKLLKQAKGLGW